MGTELDQATAVLGEAITKIVGMASLSGLSDQDAIKATRNLLLVAAASLDGKLN